jgi:hypothetical protein
MRSLHDDHGFCSADQTLSGRATWTGRLVMDRDQADLLSGDDDACSGSLKHRCPDLLLSWAAGSAGTLALLDPSRRAFVGAAR